MTKIIGLIGYKKSGKTTTAERLIGSLKARGFRVGTVKFIHLSHIELDIEGKDTYRHMQAGADFVFSLTPTETVLIHKTQERMNIDHIVDNLPRDVDFLICEGLRSNGFDARFILTGKNEEQIDSFRKEIGIGTDSIIGISGVVANRLSKHAGCRVFNCLDNIDIEHLTDAVVNAA